MFWTSLRNWLRVFYLLDANSFITVQNLNAHLRKGVPWRAGLCMKILAHAVDEPAYISKQAGETPFERNFFETKNSLKEKIEWLLGANVLNAMKNFFDQFGSKIQTRQLFGRALKGHCTIRIASTQSDTKATDWDAVAPNNRLLHFTVIGGCMAKEIFTDLFEEVSRVSIGEG